MEDNPIFMIQKPSIYSAYVLIFDTLWCQHLSKKKRISNPVPFHNKINKSMDSHHNMKRQT